MTKTTNMKELTNGDLVLITHGDFQGLTGKAVDVESPPIHWIMLHETKEVASVHVNHIEKLGGSTLIEYETESQSTPMCSMKVCEGLNKLMFTTKRLIPKRKQHLIEYYSDKYTSDGIRWKFDYKNYQYNLFYSFRTKTVQVEREIVGQSKSNAI